MCGKGKSTFADGSVYEGEFKNHEFYQGKVRYYDDSGTIHECEFVSVEDE